MNSATLMQTLPYVPSEAALPFIRLPLAPLAVVVTPLVRYEVTLRWARVHLVEREPTRCTRGKVLLRLGDTLRGERRQGLACSMKWTAKMAVVEKGRQERVTIPQPSDFRSDGLPGHLNSSRCVSC